MDLDRYNETLDFASSSKFKTLTLEQQNYVRDTYVNAYRSSIHMGSGIATGKAVQNALALIEQIHNSPKVRAVEQPVPASIFAGLENCI